MPTQRQEKNSLRSLEVGTFKKLQAVLDNIATGEKAVKTLTSDLGDVDRRVDEISEKIAALEEATDKLERKVTRVKDVEQMNVRELEHQIKYMLANAGSWSSG